MKVSLTGASGFLGSRLAGHPAARGPVTVPLGHDRGQTPTMARAAGAAEAVRP